MINALLYVVTVAIWGSTWLVITFQLQDSPASTAVAWRFIIAFAMLLVWCALRRVSLRLRPLDYLLVTLQGLSNFGVNYWLIYLAEERVPSGLVAMMFTLLMVFNLLGAKLFMDQPISWRSAVGAAIGVIGVCLVFSPELAQFEGGSKALSGLLCALAGTLCASVGNLLSVRTQKSVGLMPTITIGMGAGGLLMLAVAWLSGDRLSVPLTVGFFAPLLYLSLFGSVIAFAAYISLMARVGPGRASYNGVMIPLVALLLSTFFEGYQWQPASIAGAVLSLVGNVLVMRGKTPTP